MNVSFYGVRGSYPCPSPVNARYGANTASVYLESGTEPPILLDLGTGVHRLASDRAPLPLRATALVTHLHLDHVQGLPFFTPLQRAGSSLDVYAPKRGDVSLAQAFEHLVREPHYPFELSDLPGAVRFHEVVDEQLQIGTATVRARPVPHVGPTVGYRIEWGGATIAYISDHQAPTDRQTVSEDVLALCHGVDLLIHEGQYTDEEFARKRTWGHCTPEYALVVAQRAGVRRLCVFHHDPGRTDDELDELAERLHRRGGGLGIDVLIAAEGTRIEL